MSPTMAVALRLATLLLLVLVCAPSLVGAWAARGTSDAPQLLAIVALTASPVYSQISLIGTPVTSRTYVNLAAALIAAACLAAGVRRGASAVTFTDLPADTRDLILRHPNLLQDFEEYRRSRNLEEGGS